MNETARFTIGALLLTVIQIAMASGATYFARKWTKALPPWSFWKALGMFVLLALVVSGISLIPVVGLFTAAVVSLAGFKRFTGLSLFSAFILVFILGASILAIGAVLSSQLDVDLLLLPDPRS